MNNKVAIYVRVSTDEQRDNGYSIDSQLRMLKEYADKNNYNIVGIYNDVFFFLSSKLLSFKSYLSNFSSYFL